MTIRFIGQRNILGAGTLYSGLLDAIGQVHVIRDFLAETDATNPAQMRAAATASRPEDINVWLCEDQRMQGFKGAHIVWAIFESDRLPRAEAEFLSRVPSVIWVPSHWGRDVLVAGGVPAERIDVVTGGIDVNLFNPHLRRALTRTEGPFRFLAVGKYEKRKAYGELFDAFQRAFGGDRGVELVVKADYFTDADRKKEELTSLVREFPAANVKLLWGAWPREGLAELYRECDAFVFPSRAEGWGLPALEAAATGLPVIATYYSAQTEFLQYAKTSSLPVDFELVTIGDPEYLGHQISGDASAGRWAQPSTESLARCMRTVRDEHSTFAEAAITNSFVLREKFSWAAVAAHAVDSMVRRKLLRLVRAPTNAPGPGSVDTRR